MRKGGWKGVGNEEGWDEEGRSDFILGTVT